MSDATASFASEPEVRREASRTVRASLEQADDVDRRWPVGSWTEMLGDMFFFFCLLDLICTC